MSMRGVSGWMFLLVPAHLGRPGQRAVKRSCVCVCALHFKAIFNSRKRRKLFMQIQLIEITVFNSYTTTTTILQPFVEDYPGESLPEG